MQHNDVDITGKIGPFPRCYEGQFEPTEPMYSFAGPSCTVWNAFANVLMQQGCTERQALDILRSKLMRWELDGDLTERLDALARLYAKAHAQEWIVEMNKWSVKEKKA